MNEDRIQIEAAFKYLNDHRNVRIDMKACRFYANRVGGLKK